MYGSAPVVAPPLRHVQQYSVVYYVIRLNKTIRESVSSWVCVMQHYYTLYLFGGVPVLLGRPTMWCVVYSSSSSLRPLCCCTLLPRVSHEQVRLTTTSAVGAFFGPLGLLACLHRTDWYTYEYLYVVWISTCGGEEWQREPIDDDDMKKTLSIWYRHEIQRR